MGTSILTEILSILGGSITGFAGYLGQGVQALVTDLFLQTTGTGSDAVTSLSTFGIVVAIFAGLSLTISLSRAIVIWLGSLGGRKVH